MFGGNQTHIRKISFGGLEQAKYRSVEGKIKRQNSSFGGEIQWLNKAMMGGNRTGKIHHMIWKTRTYKSQ